MSSGPDAGAAADDSWKVWTTRDGRRLDTPAKLAAYLRELEAVRADPDELAQLHAAIDAEAARRNRLTRR